jgi:hypothetical protein
MRKQVMEERSGRKSEMLRANGCERKTIERKEEEKTERSSKQAEEKHA